MKAAAESVGKVYGIEGWQNAKRHQYIQKSAILQGFKAQFSVGIRYAYKEGTVALGNGNGTVETNKGQRNKGVNMKIKWLLMGTVVASMVSLAATVKADTITGGIGFSGAYEASSTDLSTPGLVITFPTPVLVNTDSGIFSSVAIGSTVSMISSLTVNPAEVPVGGVWAVGGFTFTLSSFTETYDSKTAIVLSGSGTLTTPTGQAYSADWVTTFNSLGMGTLTFSASSAVTASAPDGGTTVTLLGVALSALGLLRRKFAV